MTSDGLPLEIACPTSRFRLQSRSRLNGPVHQIVKLQHNRTMHG